MDALVDEDRRLRLLGHPQTNIYMFRSADLNFDTIKHLPVPWYDTHGSIPDPYWHLLSEYGIPSSALPTGLSQRGPSLSAREQELRSYSSLASHGFSRSASGLSSNPAALAPYNSSFAARFGSPVRPINYSVPSSPARSPATASPSTAELLHRASHALLRTPPNTGSDTLSGRNTHSVIRGSPQTVLLPELLYG